ncbi:hypothetical protein K432DRAFT_387716 [Lepidopterella palustris CBS 459.81]|uniref:Uncharacterized protein n=1 Tax=Lepidopterella palustris CBS 459.81 TaxID=1314670 RepID=A0A8E2J7T8_9PEZI|nr:hypothetical protein K432DRAFT_387716 [Lepidopterella palustris CBS 459.81]
MESSKKVNKVILVLLPRSTVFQRDSLVDDEDAEQDKNAKDVGNSGDNEDSDQANPLVTLTRPWIRIWQV